MNVRLTCLAMAVVAAGSLFSIKPALAQPNCNTCMPAYYACVDSGRTDCDTAYAVCLRWCPLASVSAPKPIKRSKPHESAISKKDTPALVAAAG
ncbi:hypothetical protein [Frateuria sp. YIM B11624]|uniref:hypothetical protein n=1 Tax=Frateuria sp. YIM B11624 TaxID=3143185 RepID=UPI003C77F2E5